MQTNNRNQNMQIPSMEGGAAQSENMFHATINKFFESNDESGHIHFLTQLCRAFTGISFEKAESTLDIANGVFSVNEIKDFLVGVENSYDQMYMTASEGAMIGKFLDPIGSQSAIDVLNDAVLMWIHPDEPDHTIDYLSYAIEVFKNVTELVRVCNRINNHYQFTMEGGAAC